MKNQTKIVVLLDKSGSMSYNAAKTVEGFNEFIASQEVEPGDATISLYQFANRIETTYLNVPIKSKQVKKLKLSVPTYTSDDYIARTSMYFSYIPNGTSTALRDAVGTIVNNTGLELSELPEYERPNKVIVVIITDGHDNSSVEFSLSKIKEMITHQQQMYNWTFLFLGANISSTEEAKSYGISINTVASYEGTENIGNAFRGASAYTSLSRSYKAVDISLHDAVNDIKNK